MQRVSLICLGRLKEKYLVDACAEYIKRLRPYCRLEIIELPPVALPEDPSQAQINEALQAEAQKITARIPKGAAVVSLCIEGEQISSPEFSSFLQSCALNGDGSVAFVIGSSYGLSESIKALSKKRLSMSKMTFPHQLARVMLLEQLYRAFQISTNGKYHK